MDIPVNYFQYHPSAARFTTPGGLIGSLLPNVLVIAGLVFLFIIIFSGYNLMQDAGSGNQQSMAKHKAALTSGIIGFLLVVSAYFILQIVGYGTGVNFTNLGDPSVQLNPPSP